jgi:23S rRNA (uracil1939-C5)-methyltransferase
VNDPQTQNARTHTLELLKMVHGGLCMARLDDGRVALVRGGLPGETVTALLQARSGVLQGDVQDVLEPSPDRVPASEHPGLDYSFIRYERQLELKREVVADALSRSLQQDMSDTSVPPVVAAPEVWAYRNTVQPATTRQGLGYRQPDSHEVTLLTADPVAQPAINALWRHLKPPKGVREVVFRCNDAGEVLLAFIASASARNYLSAAHDLVRDGVQGVSYAQFDPRGRFRGGFERLAGERSIRQRYGHFEVSISATSFAQPNPRAATQLYLTLEQWAGEGDAALDLYAGNGIIGMHLARRYGRVNALEVDRGSITRGQQDAARLGISNLEFTKVDAKRLDILPQADLITVDPPRAGLAKPVKEALTGSSASRLIYVSCDVATWARDVTQLIDAGWTLERFQPHDFYPQTHHIEMLSLLTR